MLVILVIAMTVIAVLGAAFVSIVGSKQQGFTLLRNGHRATMIARAGIEWAIRFASEGNIVKGSNMPFDPDKLDEGSFSTDYDEKKDVLTVDGTYQGTTQRITLSNFRRYLKIGDVSFALSMDSFKPVESKTGQSIAVDKTAGIIHLGLKTQNTAGAVWYGGDSNAANCVNGVCDFGSGFRAYFVFQYAPGSTGDGFTFAVTSGNNNNNTATSIGGDSQMGELMAYGGDSRSYVRYDDDRDYITSFLDGAGKGLRPPKFAVEFDIYSNTTGCSDFCSGRCDPSNEQHMAYVFWGDDKRIGCKDAYTRWMSSFSFPANTVVCGTIGKNTYLYRLLGDLTTGTTEPSWPSGKGSTVEESGVQWKECSWRASTDYTWGDFVAPSYSYISATANRFFFRESEFWGLYKTGASEPTWTDCDDVSESPCTDKDAKWYPFFYGGPRVVNYATNSRTYDDNRHTPGTGTNAGDSTTNTGPTNTRPTTPATSSDNYYTNLANPSAWLANATNPSAVNHTYAYRIEVVRNSTARTYQIKSWIKTCDPSWSASTEYAINDLIRPTANNEYYNKCYYLASNPGTSGTTQPAWSETGTVDDGTIKPIKWKPVCTWKASHEYAVDELIRPTASNGYFYTARTAGTSSSTEPTWPDKGRVTDEGVTWLPYQVGICNKYTNGTFGDVQSDYTADSATLDRTITLDSTYNTAFEKFLFGWTTASGGATQRADVWKFRLTFKP
jgi:hypothetical protein